MCTAKFRDQGTVQKNVLRTFDFADGAEPLHALDVVEPVSVVWLQSCARLVSLVVVRLPVQPVRVPTWSKDKHPCECLDIPGAGKRQVSAVKGWHKIPFLPCLAKSATIRRDQIVNSHTFLHWNFGHIFPDPLAAGVCFLSCERKFGKPPAR